MPKPVAQYPLRTTPKTESKWEILVRLWGTPLLAGLIGIMAGLVGARATEESAERKLFLELRVRHADELAKQFAIYTETQSRIKIICDLKQSQQTRDDEDFAKGKLSQEQVADNKAIQDRRQKTLIEIGTQRQVARDLLQSEFGALRLYFGPRVIAKTTEFVSWDRKYRIATCRELPNDPFAWERYMNEILDLLHLEIAWK